MTSDGPRWCPVAREPDQLSPTRRMRFVASLLGRTIDSTYEITRLVPGEHLTMTSASGPFPMTTTCTVEDDGRDELAGLSSASSAARLRSRQ